MPDFDEEEDWTGERYEYLLLTGLPLGDTHQTHLTKAGQRGWRVVQVGMEQSALGHATGIWALLERELPPADADLPFATTRPGHQPSRMHGQMYI